MAVCRAPRRPVAQGQADLAGPDEVREVAFSQPVKAKKDGINLTKTSTTAFVDAAK